MADNQIEHGFTRIPSALLEAMCRTSLTDEEHRIFAALIRLTFGYEKRVVCIGLAEISAATGIVPCSVTRVLQNLEDTGMIERSRFEPGHSRRIGIVLDFERWTAS